MPANSVNNAKCAKPWPHQPDGMPLRLGHLQKTGPGTVLLLDATEQNLEAILLGEEMGILSSSQMLSQAHDHDA